MARNCSVCSRADAGTINELLLDGRSGRSVAAQFGVSDAAMGRHARHHLVRQPVPVSATSRRRDAPAEMLQSGRSVRSVALEVGLSEDALGRHAKNHLPASRLASRPPRRETLANRVANDPLDELVDALRARALAGSDAASREYRLALQAQSAARHAAAPTRDLESEPEFIALQTRLLRLLEPFPEAQQIVADGLGLER